jgi:hypothetical protein
VALEGTSKVDGDGDGSMRREGVGCCEVCHFDNFLAKGDDAEERMARGERRG